MTAGEIAWSKQLWDSLNDRGTWSIPRSGLVFQKHEAEREFVLLMRMPWEPMMFITPEQLAEQQQVELDGIAKRFEAFGVRVYEKYPEGEGA